MLGGLNLPRIRPSEAIGEVDRILKRVMGRGLADYARQGWDQLTEVFQDWLASREAARAGDVSATDYAALGLSPKCCDEVLRSAYRALAKKHHPDAGGDPQAFAALSEAYERILRSRGLRR